MEWPGKDHVLKLLMGKYEYSSTISSRVLSEYFPYVVLFLKEDSFLLIDEPTNHLDTLGRKTLSDYLKKHGFILASHDRVFLDNCIDQILVINKTNIEVRGGTSRPGRKTKKCRTALNGRKVRNTRAEKESSACQKPV